MIQTRIQSQHLGQIYIAENSRYQYDIDGLLRVNSIIAVVVIDVCKAGPYSSMVIWGYLVQVDLTHISPQRFLCSFSLSLQLDFVSVLFSGVIICGHRPLVVILVSYHINM